LKARESLYQTIGLVEGAGLKYKWSEFVGVFRNPIAMGCTGVKQCS